MARKLFGRETMRKLYDLTSKGEKARVQWDAGRSQLRRFTFAAQLGEARKTYCGGGKLYAETRRVPTNLTGKNHVLGLQLSLDQIFLFLK